MTTYRRSTWFLLAAFAALGACRYEASPETAILVDTLTGGIIRVRNPDPATVAWLPAWSIVEERRIGSVDGDYAFGEIRDLTVDPLKRIYVLDFQDQRISVFDSLGRRVAFLGGQGAGPGELRSANGLAWSGGHLWVNDVGNARYDVFQSDGGFVTSFRRKAGSFGYRWVGGVDHEGAVYEQDTKPGPIDRTPGLKQERFDLFLVRLDTASGRVDTLPLPSDSGRFYRLPRGTRSVPFSSAQLLDFDARGYVWVARTGSYRIHQTRVVGDTVRVIERAYSPLLVTAAERKQAIDGIERFMEDRGGRAKLDYSAIPDVKPGLAAMDVDDQGRLWVRPVTDTDGTSFDIFDTEGRLIATAHAAFPIWAVRRVSVVGNTLVSVVSDSLRVDYVVIARINTAAKPQR